MALKPCLACGTLTNAGSYCQRHLPRDGSTRRWRKTRALILERDGYRCRYCAARATAVDHVTPVAKGGTDVSVNLVATCAAGNARKGAR